MRKFLFALFFFPLMECAVMKIYDPITKVIININPSAVDLQKLILKIVESIPAVVGAVK